MEVDLLPKLYSAENSTQKFLIFDQLLSKNDFSGLRSTFFNLDNDLLNFLIQNIPKADQDNAKNFQNYLKIFAQFLDQVANNNSIALFPNLTILNSTISNQFFILLSENLKILLAAKDPNELESALSNLPKILNLKIVQTFYTEKLPPSLQKNLLSHLFGLAGGNRTHKFLLSKSPASIAESAGLQSVTEFYSFNSLVNCLSIILDQTNKISFFLKDKIEKHDPEDKDNILLVSILNSWAQVGSKNG